MSSTTTTQAPLAPFTDAYENRRLRQFTDEIACARPVAVQRLLIDGCEIPEPCELWEMLGVETPPTIATTDYANYSAMLTALYALGFAMGQLVPTLGRDGAR
jgi:hypothetical protein